MIAAAEILKRLSAVEGELNQAKASLPSALEAGATAYLSGATTDEVASTRTQIRRLEDLAIGLRRCALRAEYAEVSKELAQRKRKYESDSASVERLRREAAATIVEPEGTGPAWGQEMKRLREERNAKFSTYERTSLAHADEAHEIAKLGQRLSELADDLEN